MKPIIKVENIAKQYHIQSARTPQTSLREYLTESARSSVGKVKRLVASGDRGSKSAESSFWALDDVSFEVAPGEVVGIIGRNGAGKSTLLKILSRITEPTRGRIKLYGRVGSLLEVGTGFHPDLSGRENVFLNGAILGMKRAEITTKFDEIVAFAELERFVDTPVKRYSSGMYTRLAFAVAAHLEPEILIVDEVLAVGDTQFQKKCLGKMGEVAKQGRTILFVSHNMVAVQSLCSRAVWLDKGQVVEDDDSDRVVSSYLRQSASTSVEQKWDDINEAPGNEVVRLHRVSVRLEDNTTSSQITVRTPFLIEAEYWNLELGAHLNLSLVIFNEQDTIVFNTTTIDESVWHGRPFSKGLFRSICRIPGDLMNDGLYKVCLMVVKDESIAIFTYNDIVTFEVHEVPRRGWLGKWVGAVRPKLEWVTEVVDV